MIRTLFVASLGGLSAFGTLATAAHYGAHAYIKQETRFRAWFRERQESSLEAQAKELGFSLARPERPWREIVDEVAREENLSRCLLRGTIFGESANKPEAVSRSGAIGLMQVMPATAKSFAGVKSVKELINPETNIRVGAKYLKHTTGIFGLENGLAAYNAGPGAVAAAQKKAKGKSFREIKHLLPEETRGYVPTVLGNIKRCEDLS